MERLKLFGLVVVAALAGFAAVMVIAALLEGPNTTRRLASGEMADFQFQTPPAPIEASAFNDEDGEALTLADFAGRTILVNLWATWCTPCVEELPTLDALQKSLGSERFEVVTISIDRGKPDKPERFFKQLGITALTLYHDPTTKIGLGLEAMGLPTTLLINERGEEIGRLMGPADWNSPEARALIKAFIPQAEGAGPQAEGPGPQAKGPGTNAAGDAAS